ncbi:polyhydroxyalkanoate synthase [Nocardia farcinica]|uniref:Poly-beta-hydroxybutyrate polymerase n=1 Tax=Nocardia farcinica TaxID=37329 RepID=A0A0H5P5X3_NOCFR|nr:alpha/beta fold hydrolase [Nocardia farcinica]AXK88092.1 alpha/beta hydrolase [Nocardia farcinica]MBA4854881.1 alpha/beta hydrolase [Nocardia farcinica]MBC9814956.1 alpha/beta hydrolase [Nocardia farcinica]CRY83200.1 Poly-beta-hydroxybutyrate polymerase [Nocardia farcinica]SIT18486.1 polyhydroxyalkanoate synthase [Nocardia farcinica]
MSLADTLTLAARNAWALTFGPGVEAPEPTRSTVLWDAPHRELRRFERDEARDGAAAEGTDPVLLVPPLAAPASCFDLRPDQSLARFLLGTGRTPYVVDYGEITFADRRMGFEDWINDILPEAVLRTSADRDGAAVDLVGWSLGGTLALLTAAAHPQLPIGSITAVGSPLDYDRMTGMPQVRAVAKLDGGLAVSTAVRAAGGIPAPLTRAAYRVTAWNRELTRPLFVASNIARTEALAKMESIDRFMAQMPGYPGRFYGQLWGRLILNNDIGRGVLRLGGREIALAAVTAPVLLVGGPADVITPAPAVEAGTRTLTGAAFVRYETAPGSHLGILTGETARETTWTYLDEFLTEAATMRESVS